VGNVGQLAVDLLISSLDLQLVEHSPASKFMLPLVGPDAYAEPGSKQLSTSLSGTAPEFFCLHVSICVDCCLVYSNKEKTLLVIQQRSDFLAVLQFIVHAILFYSLSAYSQSICRFFR
jgi:hypothetical protein